MNGKVVSGALTTATPSALPTRKRSHCRSYRVKSTTWSSARARPETSCSNRSTPELVGCRTHGATYEEAVKKGQEAIEGWIEDACAWGEPVPEPRVFVGA